MISEEKIRRLALKDLVISLVVMFVFAVTAIELSADVMAYTTQAGVDYILLNNQLLPQGQISPELWDAWLEEMLETGQITLAENQPEQAVFEANVPMPLHYTYILAGIIFLLARRIK